jgi:hypothetical protein
MSRWSRTVDSDVLSTLGELRGFVNQLTDADVPSDARVTLGPDGMLYRGGTALSVRWVERDDAS